MLKKLFVSLTVITLSTLTSFPTFAGMLSNSDNKVIHEFRYDEFKENIDNVEKLTANINSTTINQSNKKVANNDISSENINSSDDSNDVQNNTIGYISSFIMESTAYTGGTVTATGTAPVRDENGLSTIAVDPSVIPLGSLLYIDGYGYAIAADTGGVIHGNIIDLYLNSYDECINWGRRDVSVNLIAYPGQW